MFFCAKLDYNFYNFKYFNKVIMISCLSEMSLRMVFMLISNSIIYIYLIVGATYIKKPTFLVNYIIRIYIYSSNNVCPNSSNSFEFEFTNYL